MLNPSEDLIDAIRKGEWWRDKAACADTETEVFFDKGRRSEATELCRLCPVNNCCLDYALQHERTYGVYGGYTPAQRAKYRWELTHYVRNRLREGAWGSITILGRDNALQQAEQRRSASQTSALAGGKVGDDESG